MFALTAGIPERLSRRAALTLITVASAGLWWVIIEALL